MITYILVAAVLINIAVSQTIDKKQCGKSIGCFRNPDNCDPEKDCVAAISWKVNGGNVDFVMMSKLSGSNSQYVSVGLSEDDHMGKDSVMACISSLNRVTVSYNPSLSNELIADAQSQISGGSVVTDRGILKCSFSRAINPSTSQPDKIYKFSNAYYLMLATGNAESNSNLKRHDLSGARFPKVSKSKVAFSTTKYVDLKGAATSASHEDGGSSSSGSDSSSHSSSSEEDYKKPKTKHGATVTAQFTVLLLALFVALRT